MKLIFAQDGGITNTGTAEEELFKTVLPAAAQTSQAAKRIVEIRGSIFGASLDKRIRLYDVGIGGNVYYDSGSDLNNLTGSWLMTITQQYDGISTIEMVVGTSYFHKQTSSIAIPTTNSLPPLAITAECESTPAASVVGARWYVIDSSILL